MFMNAMIYKYGMENLEEHFFDATQVTDLSRDMCDFVLRLSAHIILKLKI